MYNFLKNQYIISNPLEQFNVMPIFPIYFDLSKIKIANLFEPHWTWIINFTINNTTIILALLFINFLVLTKTTLIKNKYFLFFPNVWQFIIEGCYTFLSTLIHDNFKSKGHHFFAFLITIFFFIILSNLTGLIPFTPTITSQLSITLFISLMIFIGGNYLATLIHKLYMVSFFFPAGTSFLLGLILVPIEIISYLFRPIALAVRLFANMMAGHTLLKVVSGFVFTLMKLGHKDLSFLILHLIAFSSLFFLFALESSIAFIQTYVFIILSTMYLADAIDLSH